MRCVATPPGLCLFNKRFTASQSRQWHLQSVTAWRLYSSAPEVKAEVRVGSSGYISLDIRPPPRPSSDSPVIIYLPRGSNVIKSGPDLLPSIALSSNATVVRVNYRLSTQHPYPTPIHDVLAGYDWIKSNLGQGATSLSDGAKLNQARRLGVCGELIGGSLAGMLALTECHTESQGISAAVLGNPVADWTSLFPVDENSDANDLTPSQHSNTERAAASGTSSQNSPTINSLLQLRKKIFPQPAKFFDPFASPSLFFCTPAMELPPAINLLLDDQTSSSEPSLSSSDHEPLSLSKKRRHRRTYPPSNTSLRIPRIRIEVGKENILHDQDVEFAQLIRKSRSTREELGEQLEKGEEAYEEGEKSEVLKREGAGLWGEKEADEVGRWFAQSLC